MKQLFLDLLCYQQDDETSTIHLQRPQLEDTGVK